MLINRTTINSKLKINHYCRFEDLAFITNLEQLTYDLNV